jgi:DNA primase
MAFSPAFLDELRARFNLSDVVGRRVRLIKRGREHTGLCPFHNEKTPSFTVSDDKGFFHCFGCGTHGDVVGFVMKTENLSFPEAVERLAEEAGLPIPKTTPEDKARTTVELSLFAVTEAAAKWFEERLKAPEGRMAREYLARRGVDAATIAKFRLGFAPDARGALKSALAGLGFPESLMVAAGLLVVADDGRAPYDRFRGRLMFPIEDQRGRVVAFGGRILGDGEPKYLNSPETPLFHKGRLLYGLKNARDILRAPNPSAQQSLIVVEGYMDAIAALSVGLPAVAPLGTALGEDQIALLWRLAPEPILCFDGDNAGRRAASRAAERALPILVPGKSVRIAHLPKGEDPDSLIRQRGRDSLVSILASARNLVEFAFEIAVAGRPINTPERKAAIEVECANLARKIQHPGIREKYARELKEKCWQLFGFARRKAQAGVVPPPVSRPDPLEGGELGRSYGREVELVAIVLNHPRIVQEILEELAALPFEFEANNDLKALVLEHLPFSNDGEEVLDVAAWTLHLKHRGFEPFFANLSRPENALLLLPAVQNTAPDIDAVIVWREMAQLQRRVAFRKELLERAAEFAQGGGDEEWERLQATKEHEFAEDMAREEELQKLLDRPYLGRTARH